MKQEKSSNKPPNEGYQKVLVKVKDALCSPMMGAPTKEWGEPQSPGIMFFQISTQEAPHTEAINKNIKKGNTIIIHMSDNILNAAEEARINKIGVFSATILHASHSSTENTYQISDILPMENIHVSIVTQE